MEGEAAAAILQTLVQNLIDLCKKEISQIQDLDKDASKLAGNLDMIKNFLNDAETRTITSGDIKSWLMKLEDVAFDADNVLDEITYHILSKQIKATKPLKAKVLSCFSCCKNLSRSRNMALKIKEINENLESINKGAAELGLVGRLSTEPTLVIASSETDSFSDDQVFIGRDDVKLKIVEMLTNSITTDERRVFILPIVGMGGLGKTTLTRKVFNHEKIKGQFGSRIWVHVSPNFDPIILFKKILNKLTSYPVEIADRQDILSKLQEELKDKTYLLILDDVWNEDASKWKDFVDSLLGVSSVNENAIVVTTRSMKVASVVNPLQTLELEGLSDEDCWSIIKVRTFGKENVPSEFEAIGKKIAGRCKGSPLAANVVGGILRIKSEEKWRTVEEKWLSAEEGGDEITNILRLSFNNLSLPSLKKCFTYCAMFPKGYKIFKQELIEMWMAEGFLQAQGRDDMESVGQKFVNVLLHNSLLQVLWGDYYCMHDLVHDLACSVSSSSNSTGGSSRVRYMTLEEDESSRIQEMAKSLRTLLITSKGDISDINFSDLESLHVLRLDSEVMKELPSSIQKLIHLRDFDISKSEIEVLPDWIGEFFHLQTLRVDSQYLKKLPSTIKYLINLRHLYIDENVELPMGIGRLTSLQTLRYFSLGEKNGCKIEELGSLNNLKGELNIFSLKKVHDKEEAEKANLFKKSKILKLCLKWKESCFRSEGETNDENILEGLQPHSNLRELEIDGFNGKRFPLWTLKMAVRDMPGGSWVVLNKLMSLSLVKCCECEEIPMLGHLQNLKSLRLERLFNLKCINSSFYGMVNKDTRIVVFPALERFELHHMHDLAEWAEIEISDGSEVEVFPRLQRLVIENCDQLMSVPSHVSSFLEDLTIDGRRLTSLQTRNLEDLTIDGRRLTSLQTRKYFPVGDENGCKIEELASLNNHRGELEICNLERVHNKEEAIKANLFKKSKILKLCLSWGGGREGETNDEDVLEGLQPHSDLRELEISLFKGKRFPSWTQKMAVRDAPQGSWVVLNKLMSLSLVNCTECEEIPMLGHLQNLKSLHLEGLSNLKCINSSFYGMVNYDTRIVFPALEKFKLSLMPKLAEWAEIEIPDGIEVKLFPLLQHLEIIGCEQLKRVPSLGQLPNLMSLKLEGLSNLKCINSSFYGMVNKDTRIVFPALERLELQMMEKLAEWAEIEISDGSEVKVFPRLQFLKIEWCKKLKSVPSLGQLPNLKSISLDGLSNLKCINSSFYGTVNKDTRFVFPALKHLWLTSMPKLTQWAEIEISYGSKVKVFPRLQHLRIRDCSQLMSVPRHVSTCLEDLYIRGIGVECLPADWLFSNNQTLSYVHIENCPNLREISDSGGQQSQGRSFASLRHLEISECEALEYLPCEMLGFSIEDLSLEGLSSPKLPRLSDLTIKGVPKLMATCSLEIPRLPMLRILRIDVCMGLETVDAILQGCCLSLDSLLLYGVESWECLSESIQHLTSLSDLRLIDFGMKELPEWLGNLSSLNHLWLLHCKTLRRLPSMDAMRRLTTLKKLYIIDCPRLVIKSEAAHSEWPKVFHIPHIEIDGRPIH